MILMDAEKAFHKIQHPLMIKILKKLGIEGKFLNTFKGICEKSTANIILDGGKLDAFLLRSGIRHFYLMLYRRF